MAPVHESDVAETRWERDSWKYVELWEKVELRLLKRKRLWILGTGILFFLLSSVPVFVDRAPKWETLRFSRSLAGLISQMKTDAAIQHRSFRIRFTDPLTMDYVVERGDSCRGDGFEVVQNGRLLADRVRLLSPELSQKLGIPRVITTFCYDFLEGALLEKEIHAFGAIPVKDLTETDLPPRLDRVSLLLLKGKAAEISFN